jgi:hypothetical protein
MPKITAGGFLFSAMELEAAVRLNANIVQLVWIDGSYDMVAVQEVLKYGRKSGVNLGPVDLVKYAQAFGATGRMIQESTELKRESGCSYSLPSDRRSALFCETLRPINAANPCKVHAMLESGKGSAKLHWKSGKKNQPVTEENLFKLS